MTFLSGRRLASACVVSAAFAVAAFAPGSASASPDLLKQCEGANTKGHGSTFQAPILEKWAVDFNTSKNIYACGGFEGQGSGGKPKVEYLSSATSDKGSGACLKGWGAEVPESEPVDFGEFGFCGTDEAPNPTQKKEIEKRKTGGEAESLETIPVAQGAVAIIVHLPEGCKAESEVEPTAGKPAKLGRLVLEDTVLEEVYRGAITNWKQLLEKQKTGSDKLTCTGGTAEEETTIKPVVRLDHSGTTHIFKAFLEQVNPSEEITMEAYPEEIPGSGKKTGCGKAFPEEKELWSATAEACQNQRWPAAAKVVRPTATGNPGVIKYVGENASSIGYGDLAEVRKLKYFSANCKVTTPCGGENKKGSATKLGEQNTKFWVEMQNKDVPSISGYSEPASKGDIEAVAQSNCKNTVYTNVSGKKFPPASTREVWNEAKAELEQTKTYAICGLTYDLALRQYKYYPGTSQAEATTVENFLRWAINTKAEGGGAFVKNSDYEKVSGTIVKEGEKGVEEIGWEIG